MRRLALVSAVVAFAASPAAACEWSMGWEDWPPYQFTGDDGLTGLDVQIVRAVADEAGCTVSFSEVPWARHLDQLSKGDIDLAAGASRTPEREGFAFFSEPYRSEGVALLTRADSGYTDLEGLLAAGGNLGTVRGYEYGDAVAALIDGAEYGAQVAAVDSDETNYKKLLAGRIDGMILDPYAAGSLSTALGGETKIVATLAESPIHVMFSQASTDEAAVAAFNAALAAIRESGRYDDIVARYTGAGS